MTLNYIEQVLTSNFAVTVCISIYAFASLVNISKGDMSSTIGLNICAKKKFTKAKIILLTHKIDFEYILKKIIIKITSNKTKLKRK